MVKLHNSNGHCRYTEGWQKIKKSLAGTEAGTGMFRRLRTKKRQTEHRTATTAYPCYLPVLGGFSRSWSCRLAGAKIYKNLAV